MITIVVFAIIIVGIAVLGLGMSIFFGKGKFPEHELGHNKKMKELGIKCSRCEEIKRYKKAQRYKNVTLDLSKL
ncbi:MAG: hypothetical protein SNJ71_04770 [Bacteroidales bacterium]